MYMYILDQHAHMYSRNNISKVFYGQNNSYNFQVFCKI